LSRIVREIQAEARAAGRAEGIKEAADAILEWNVTGWRGAPRGRRAIPGAEFDMREDLLALARDPGRGGKEGA
jgi:hypothetical protein